MEVERLTGVDVGSGWKRTGSEREEGSFLTDVVGFSGGEIGRGTYRTLRLSAEMTAVPVRGFGSVRFRFGWGRPGRAAGGVGGRLGWGREPRRR